ncbi:bacteriocin-associated integral membrane family protein [Streptomyces sp. NPDC047706]|uniref:bacteriocin-associated integral membrane family protein n=1 Tax=Streptomyces sp. NPDC047706 TaxID=3365486 RepID=UPI003711186F
MLHRGVKFAHAVILAFSALFSFLFLRSFEDQWTLGYDAVVQVTQSRDTSTSRAIEQAVESFARDYGVTVGRQELDLEHPDRSRDLYLTPAGPRADWLEDGYPAFSPGQATTTRPFSEVSNRDPRGLYYLFGDPDAVRPFLELLQQHGLTASHPQPTSPDQLSYAYGGSALAGSLVVVALVCVTMTGAGVLLNAKAYGVLRLQGMSLPAILARDLRRLARFWTAALGVVTVVATALLAWYNHLAWFGLFALVTAATAVVFTALVLATHAAMLTLTARTGILAALKGEIPARSTAAAAYLVRVPALLLALGIAASVLQAGQDLARREDNLNVYEKAGDASTIRLNGYLGAGPDALKKLEAKVGPWLRQADADGQIVLAGHKDPARSRDAQGIPADDLIVANETFLEQQKILAPNGRRQPATTGGDGRILLLVPQHLAAHADKLTNLVPGLVSPSNPDQISSEQIDVKTTADSQEIFTYNARGTREAGQDQLSDESFLTDPVIIVVPNGTDYISDKGYTAYASQRSIVFPDPADITADIDAHHLRNEVVGISPIAADAAQAIRDITADFRLRLFNLAFALLVLLVTGVGVVIVHTRRNAQRIFARHIHGWTFATIHRTLLAAEAAIVALLVSWLPYQVHQWNQGLEQYKTMGIPAPRDPMTITGQDLTVITGLVAVEIATALAVLTFFHRRIVKEGSTEA